MPYTVEAFEGPRTAASWGARPGDRLKQRPATPEKSAPGAGHGPAGTPREGMETAADQEPWEMRPDIRCSAG